MLNQYFSNTKKYKTIVNQYFPIVFQYQKKKNTILKPRLFQHSSNAKTIKVILFFTVTTHKHTTHKKPQTQQTHNTTKPTSTQRHKTNKHTPQKQQTHKPTKQTNPHNQHTHSPTKPATAAPAAEHGGHSWVSTNIAKLGSDPGTFGVWAQHANRCATPLLWNRAKNFT